MKKHLLFAAMLTLGAAPVFATQTAATCYAVAADEETSTPATEEEYEALQKAIDDAIAKIDSLSKAVSEKYPDSDVLSSLKYTKKDLQNMSAEVKSKKEAGTLTSSAVTEYQNTVKEYSDGVANAMDQAELEDYSYKVGQVYQQLSATLYEAMDEMPLSVQNYYYNSFDDLSAAMSQAYMATMGAETKDVYEKATEKFDTLATTMSNLIEASTKAGDLVDSINATLKTLDAEMEKVKKDFPDYDLSYTVEAEESWKEYVAEFATAPAEGATVYGKDDIEIDTERFSWFKEEVENLYNMAQMDDYMSQFNDKYNPVYTKIYNYQMGLYELTNLSEATIGEYYNKLDDLGAELSQLYYKLYMAESMTQNEFDEILKTVEADSKKADDIYAEAVAADKTATGINGISVEGASAQKVYTLDGKAVKSVAGKKGAYIINGKKVILK